MSFEAFDAAVDITIAALESCGNNLIEDKGGRLVADFFETVYNKLEELEPQEIDFYHE